MSKKKRRKNKTPQTEILKKWLECGTSCADIGTYQVEEYDSMYERVEEYKKTLPAFSYVSGMFINYIFADGMSAGSVEENKVLNDFRFRQNEQGTTNNDVLRDAIRMAHCEYGECGLRWYKGNVYLYESGTYAPLLQRKDGIEYTLAYLATENGEMISEPKYEIEDFSWISDGMTLGDIENHYKDQGLLLLDHSEFVNLRNVTSKMNGEPPLERDRLRLDLLVSAYRRLNYDINYDGPGRLLFQMQDGFVSGGDNEISTTAVINAPNRKEKDDLLTQEVARIMTDIKESGSDAAIAMSSGFKQPIHLPRTTKATEFLEWIDQDVEIIADVIGLPPSLLEEGQLSGNVSMTRIVDNAMTEAIVPLREHYASQISPMLSSNLGVPKVYFDKYKLQSEESDAQKWIKVATTMQQLNTIDDPAVKEVVREFAAMLKQDILDSSGQVIELNVKEKENE